jgi:hypothetical protein
MAAEVLRRGNESALVETRHLIGEYATPVNSRAWQIML